MNAFDKEAYERAFVGNFVNPNFRPRALLELGARDKRQRFFSKLCHDYTKIFSEKFMREIGKKSGGYEQLLDIVRRHDNEAVQCYIMAYSSDDDMKLCDIEDGLKLLYSSAMSIIVLIHADYAIFQPEIELYSPRRFILSRPAQAGGDRL